MADKKLNLVGQRFGKLVVVRFAGISKFHHKLWECVCDCGNTKIENTGHLRTGQVRTCGKKGCKSLVNRAGQKYGRLTVLRFDHMEAKLAHWLCRCECGREKVMPSHWFVTGTTVSCGCVGDGRSVRYTFEGVEQTMAEWAATVPVDVVFLRGLITYQGKTFEEAMQIVREREIYLAQFSDHKGKSRD